MLESLLPTIDLILESSSRNGFDLITGLYSHLFKGSLWISHHKASSYNYTSVTNGFKTIGVTTLAGVVCRSGLSPGQGAEQPVYLAIPTVLNMPGYF